MRLSSNQTLSCDRLGSSFKRDKTLSARSPLASTCSDDIIRVRGGVFDSSFDIDLGFNLELGGGHEKVLVLNRCYLPVHITNVKRAVSLLYLDIARGVDPEYQTYSWEKLLEDEIPTDKAHAFYYLRTVNRAVPVPKVVILNDFEKRPPQNVKFSRHQVFIRDHFTCQYCARTLPKQKLNIDHVQPRVAGGKTIWENVVTSCHPCNRRKGGRNPQQAGMRLLIEPFRPRVSPLLDALKNANIAWQPFLIEQG